MAWVTFERAAKFIAGLVWASWELMVREEADLARLFFVASVLGLSEFAHLIRETGKGES